MNQLNLLKNTKPRKRLFFLLFLLTIPAAQLLYFIYVCRHSTAIPEGVDLVLIYSGNDDRTGKSLSWAKGKAGPAFLCSGMDFSRHSLEKLLGVVPNRVLLENKAMTTDQNARYSAPLLRETGTKRIALALPWYHLPRALFLTRYYLANPGVEIIPFATVSLPLHWWTLPTFRLEFIKFWGSLGRIALARFGIENWPPPQLIRSVP